MKKKIAAIVLLATILVLNIIPIIKIPTTNAAKPRKWGEQYTSSQGKVVCICDEVTHICSPCDD